MCSAKAKHFSYETSSETKTLWGSFRVRRKINSSWELNNSFQWKSWHLTIKLYCSGEESIKIAVKSWYCLKLHHRSCWKFLLWHFTLHSHSASITAENDEVQTARTKIHAVISLLSQLNIFITVHWSTFLYWISIVS